MPLRHGNLEKLKEKNNKMQYSFYDYTNLPDEIQYDILFTKGVFISDRILGDLKFVLYTLFGFYVEVTYESELNKIVSKTVFFNANI